jgi:hypothetical protein
VPPPLARALEVAAVAVASAWIAQAGHLGDYPDDAGPAVAALAEGRVGDALAAQPLMGLVSILVRAPFAAFGGTELEVYRLGVFPCVLAAGLLGLYLSGIARRAGAGMAARTLIVGVCLFNPLTFEAVQLGHPEEILTAALAVGAVAVGAEGHNVRAALLLGLALATKQWAVIAILPVLMAASGGRLRVLLGAAGVAALLTLPTLVAAPAEFAEMQGNAANTKEVVGPYSVWYAPAPETTEELNIGGEQVAVDRRVLPPLAGWLAHPLIVLLALGLPAALALRRGRWGLTACDAMALLALLALLRCALDPVNNLYYHVPLLLAAAGWDASRGELPVRSLSVLAVAVLFEGAAGDADPLTFSLAYTAAFLLAGAAIAAVLLRRPRSATDRVGTALQRA